MSVLLLLGCLLACPFRCAVSAGGRCADSGLSAVPASVASCHCCDDFESGSLGRSVDAPRDGQPAGERPADQQSDHDRRSCQCFDCICHGAVPPTDSPTTLRLPLLLWRQPADSDLLAACHAVSSQLDRCQRGSACRPSGVGARIEYQSWLI